ncbi:MAG: MBL fold metallo-hydrolase [Desulfobacteraceae bacterium]|nr:MBL fold metallo-hydrolase [Desulfobacteraceae bacterium]
MKNNLTRLTDSVSAIKTDFLFKTRLLPTHVFVLETKNGLILFDTGSPGSGKMIVESLKEAGFDPGSIRAICLSHWHRDHAGSLGEITGLVKPASGVDIFIGRPDLPLLTAQRPRILRFHPFLNIPVRHRPGRLPSPSNSRLIPLDSAGYATLDRKYGIKAIPTPGHTPGHTAYLHRETGSLFSGCALSLLNRDIVGMVPIFHDRKEQIRSGQRLAELDFRYLFPVHMFLRTDEIPLAKRLPCTGKKGIMARLMGNHLFFRYGEHAE